MSKVTKKWVCLAYLWVDENKVSRVITSFFLNFEHKILSMYTQF
jgi:hypothetical protein